MQETKGVSTLSEFYTWWLKYWAEQELKNPEFYLHYRYDRQLEEMALIAWSSSRLTHMQ